ncbi:C-glycoside deglycosidase beta subunit domain-containing protein [Clostridium sp.]
MFSENTCKNVLNKDGKINGFEMKTLITNYRGIPLSMVHDVKVEVDGNEVPSTAVKS